MKDWCSNFPDTIDGQYVGDCCQAHDIAYSKPGNWRDRRTADKVLRDCIKAKAGPFLANLMYVGVRAFGWTPWHFNRGIFFWRSK